MTMDCKALEDEIVAKGLTAPRVTKQQIDDLISGAKEIQYHVMAETVTVCCVTLSCGFRVVAYSACISPENFDSEIGQKVALDNVREKLWELEGYRLRSEMAAA